jgi:hypothetical protein
MDDLKAAIVLGSQPQYLDELYCSIGIPLPSTRVTIHTIREDFRKYDQAKEPMLKESTLVEIVLQLKPLTTAAGFKTHKSITRYLKAMEDCVKVPGLTTALEYYRMEYYRMQFRDFTGIALGKEPTKSELWTAFSNHNTWHGPLTVDQAIDQCQWITSPTAWENFQKTGTPGEPQPAKKKASSKTQKYQPSFDSEFECFNPTIKAAKPVGKATKNLIEGSWKQGVQAVPKAQPDAAIVDIAPKRKFNLE